MADTCVDLGFRGLVSEPHVTVYKILKACLEARPSHDRATDPPAVSNCDKRETTALPNHMLACRPWLPRMPREGLRREPPKSGLAWTRVPLALRVLPSLGAHQLPPLGWQLLQGPGHGLR